jgi:hypothetical protein
MLRANINSINPLKTVLMVGFCSKFLNLVANYDFFGEIARLRQDEYLPVILIDYVYEIMGQNCHRMNLSKGYHDTGAQSHVNVIVGGPTDVFGEDVSNAGRIFLIGINHEAEPSTAGNGYVFPAEPKSEFAAPVCRGVGYEQLREGVCNTSNDGFPVVLVADLGKHGIFFVVIVPGKKGRRAGSSPLAA